MDTRLILQIVLGVIIAMIVVFGALMIVALTGDADTVVVEEVADTEDDEEDENPWAGQGDAAIALVENTEVDSDPDDDDQQAPTVAELVKSTDFVDEPLNLGDLEPEGWDVEWWGETRYGPYFYRVRYGFRDEGVVIGPTWLVNLDSQEVVPKNVYGQVVTDYEEGTESEYYDQSDQVVSAIINHRFTEELNLGGALLMYFGGLAETTEGERVLGWTVEHSRDELYNAYFQWTDQGEPIYATFEFDFDGRALRPANLQATEIMRVGEGFESTERVDIMPGMYDPDELMEDRRWQGPAREQCSQPEYRDGCEAIARILDEAELIETLEWTLTDHVDSVDTFDACRQPEGDSEPRCRWDADEEDDRIQRVHYLYDIGDGQQQISWDVDLDAGIEPVDSVSELAYRAVHPRN